MLTIMIISFIFISLIMLAMSVGVLFGKPSVRNACGSYLNDATEDHNGRDRCAGCEPAKQRSCTRQC